MGGIWPSICVEKENGECWSFRLCSFKERPVFSIRTPPDTSPPLDLEFSRLRVKRIRNSVGTPVLTPINGSDGHSWPQPKTDTWKKERTCPNQPGKSRELLQRSDHHPTTPTCNYSNSEKKDDQLVNSGSALTIIL